VKFDIRKTISMGTIDGKEFQPSLALDRRTKIEGLINDLQTNHLADLH
jgi:hypothetical protein